MKHIEVVAAIVIFENRILCVQRNKNKFDYISEKYEFPGGKIEEGETKVEALQREILEELNMQIEIQSEFLTTHHEYPDFALTMHSYICTCQHTTLTLNEHIHFIWLPQDELMQLDWAAADIPIVDKLMNSTL
jgi:8-oxo-dGTP diphosphatase